MLGQSGGSWMSSLSSAPRVFISYSHDSPEHALRVLSLADALRSRGVDAWIDQYESVPAVGWPQWMIDQIAAADFVLVVCTETYRRRFEKKELPGKGKGVSWEGALISAEIYSATRHSKFLPVALAESDLQHVPIILQGTTHFLVEESEVPEKLLYAFAGESATPAPPLGEWRPLAPQTRRSIFPLTAPSAGSSVLEQYKAWALEKYSRLDLVGLGAKDFQLSFDDIYVPLRADHRLDECFKGPTEGENSRLAMSRETVEVDRLFLEEDVRHAVLLGDPGSGKTTALKKLHRLALQNDPGLLGLETGTLPVFLRLRRLDKDYFGKSLVMFLAQELEELSNAKLPPQLAEELWRGPLLLLLDGLDEIGDAQHRADVCHYLSAQLAVPEGGRLRLVISCRRSGYENLELSFSPALFEVKPLEPPQIARLVQAFFLEAGRLLGTHNAVEARKAAEELVEGIAREEQANAQVRSMVSTPLLLTLLCVVVFRGNEIPRHRVTFYEQCLRILLGHWRKQAGRLPPVEVEEALVLLETLAWDLHNNEKREGLTSYVAAGQWTQLEPSRSFEVFDWLYRDAGILAFYAEHSLGFTHLGLQEYLAARWLAKHDEEVAALCGRHSETWWREVLLQLAALDHRSFTLVVRGWLGAGALLEQADLLRQALVEARDPDFVPFLEVLRQGQADEQAAVLRLLRGRPFPELLAEAERLASEADGDVQALAADLCRGAKAGVRALDFEVAFLHEPSEDQAVARIRAALAKKGLESFQPRKGKSWRDPEEGLLLIGSSCSLVLVVGEGELSPGVFRDIENLARITKGARFILRLPASQELAGYPFTKAMSVELESLDHVQPLFEALSAARAATKPAQELVAHAAQVLVEAVTGESLFLVPGGEFMMGSTAYSFEDRPHPVKLSPYWLSRTPVTNKQYQLYLKMSEAAREPEKWRDSKYNSPDQPVVGVSWFESMSYCKWLSAASGLEISLPTEAQWEFAARGGDEQREYPWGNEEPSSEHALYLRMANNPVAVGSYPRGAARWGHLDLAGNVWEWCRDAWSEASPTGGVVVVNPWQRSGSTRRILRGGTWWVGSESLRSAARDRYRARDRSHGIGFRVVASFERSQIG